MRWKLVYSSGSRLDLLTIHEYIAHTLGQPDTADRYVLAMMEEIRSLETFPLRYPIYPRGLWKIRQLRYFRVKKYLVFYQVDEETGTVNIFRILYAQRDIDRSLEEDGRTEV